MGAYAQTTTLDHPSSIPLGIKGIRMLFGQVDITNYNQTTAEVTDITKTFRNTPRVVVNGLSDNGYDVRWNRTDKTFEAFYPVTAYTPKPTLVVEESVTVSTHAGTLAHLPAYIIAIEATAANTTGAKGVIPTGETPATKEVAVTVTTGGLIFNTSDAVTIAKVTYIPQADGTMFSSANMVVDEVLTVDVGNKQDLANQACLVQYVWNDTNSNPCVLESVGRAPSATGTAVVDIDDGSSKTNVDFHADDDADSIKVTYIKYSGVSSPGVVLLGDGDVTLTSEELEWSPDELRHGDILIPGLGTNAVFETAASAATAVYQWSPASISAGAGVPTFDPIKHKIDTDDSTALVECTMPWLILRAELLVPESYVAAAGVEVVNDTVVGVIDFYAIGR